MKQKPPQQLSLFDSPSIRMASLDSAIIRALREAVEKSGLSREEVVKKANDLARESGVAMCAGNGALSIDTFNKWLDLNSAHMPPCRSINILCHVLNDFGAIETQAEVHGYKVIGPEEQRKLEWARAQLEIRALKKKVRKIEESV